MNCGRLSMRSLDIARCWRRKHRNQGKWPLWRISKKFNRPEHLLALINDILDLSEIEAGKMGLHVETFDVAQMIEEIANTVQPAVAKNTNTLQVSVAKNAGEMRAH